MVECLSYEGKAEGRYNGEGKIIARTVLGI